MWRAASGIRQRCARPYLAQRWVSNTMSMEYHQPVLGIRREDGSQWERRAPLSPAHVHRLVDRGVKVIVQPSNKRAYPMQEYDRAGAIIEDDLSETSIILGVKQVPIDKLIPNKTYAFFSHTIKAQKDNMPLLDALIEKNVRLIDYEKMVNETGKRLVAFGKFAGIAGMINILHGLGLRFLALGHHTPFMHIGAAHNYRNSGMALQAIRDCGYEISRGMMPRSLGPMTFVFTGSGNVSQGAQELFSELPCEYVSPDKLRTVAREGSHKVVYGTVVDREDHLYRKEDGGPFQAEEYEEFPERYASSFSKNFAPWATCIVNGIYWPINSPRLLVNWDTSRLLRPESSPLAAESEGCPRLPHRLIAICDISADPGGSIEFIKESTSIEAPFCLYDTNQNAEHIRTQRIEGHGVMVCAIDNMPAQLPRESTNFFGDLLMPYIDEMLQMDASRPIEEENYLSPVIKNAIITSNGRLAPKYEYIQDLRLKNSLSESATNISQSASVKQKVLILGSGYVSAPVVEYLTRDQHTHITLASDIIEQAENISSTYKNTSPVKLSVVDQADVLNNLVKSHDLVISLLPYNFHPMIAKCCIQEKTNMVTASYLSPAMRELDESAKQAGITVVNEVGLDPGIDHMLAMEFIDDVQEKGNQVKSFVSFCGGLPAPEHSDNPLRYKFSWSPRGVLLNTVGEAKFLWQGEEKNVPPGGAILDNLVQPHFLPGFNLEGFPNRDSTLYREEYGIPTAHTILRGTLRYKGYSQMMKALQKLGLIDVEPRGELHPMSPPITWYNFIANLLGLDSEVSHATLKEAIYNRVNQDKSSVAGIVKLGLISPVLPVEKKGSPLDALSAYLSKQLAFGPGERDLIILRHEIGVESTDGALAVKNINLAVYGDSKGFSAMAKTVGLPTAIAARLMLDGEIHQKGMVVPLSREVYKPILEELSGEGIRATAEVIHMVSDEELYMK